MRKMKTRYQAIFVASCLELPLSLALAGLATKSASATFTYLLLTWYHVVPLSILTFLWLWLFGHDSPATGPTGIWTIAFWVLVFVGQVAITAPIAYLVLNRKHKRLAKRTQV
jgi:hypothetical protein